VRGSTFPRRRPLFPAAGTIEDDPDAFPIRETFGLTVVTGVEPPTFEGYGVDDPIIEVLVDVGMIADERLQEWFQASTDPSLGDGYVVTVSDTMA
jgi:hypothetical protein